MSEYDIVDSVARENAEYIDADALAFGEERVYILEPRGDD